jgi:hypothetical protein
MTTSEQFDTEHCADIGVKEIERLIKKLELDKEILADQEDVGESDVLTHCREGILNECVVDNQKVGWAPNSYG